MASKKDRIDILATLHDDVSAKAKVAQKSIGDIGKEAPKSDAQLKVLEERLEDVGDEALETAAKIEAAKAASKGFGSTAKSTGSDVQGLDAKLDRLSKTVDLHVQALNRNNEAIDRLTGRMAAYQAIAKRAQEPADKFAKSQRAVAASADKATKSIRKNANETTKATSSAKKNAKSFATEINRLRASEVTDYMKFSLQKMGISEKEQKAILTATRRRIQEEKKLSQESKRFGGISPVVGSTVSRLLKEQVAAARAETNRVTAEQKKYEDERARKMKARLKEEANMEKAAANAWARATNDREKERIRTFREFERTDDKAEAAYNAVLRARQADRTIAIQKYMTAEKRVQEAWERTRITGTSEEDTFSRRTRAIERNARVMANNIGHDMARVTADANSLSHAITHRLEPALDAFTGSNGGGGRFDRFLRSTGNRFGRWVNTFERFSRRLVGLRTFIKIFQYGSIIQGVGVLVGGLTSLVSVLGVVAARSVPILANLVAIPSLIAAGIQSLGPLMVGGARVGRALAGALNPETTAEEMAEDLKRLTPYAKEFVLEVHKLAPALQDIQKATQQHLFANFDQIVRDNAKIWLPLLNTALATTATTLNGVALYWSKVFSNADNVRNITELIARNNAIINNFGQSAARWLAVFTRVLLAAAPTVAQMGIDFGKMADVVNAWLNNNPGRLAKIFSDAYVQLKLVWYQVKNITIGLYNITKAADVFGDHLTKSFTEATEKFRDWTGSREGQDRLKNFFAKMQPIASAIAHLFGEIGTAVVQISEGPGIAKTIQDLTTLVPALTTLIQGAMNANILGSLIDIITAFSRFGQAGGWEILGTAARAFATIFDTLSAILQNSPPFVTALLKWSLGFSAVIGVVSRLATFFGVKSVLRLALGPGGWLIRGLMQSIGLGTIASRMGTTGVVGGAVPVGGGAGMAGRIGGGALGAGLGGLGVYQAVTGPTSGWNILTGAGSGALAGASIGTMIAPGIGTGIGAGVGAAIGGLITAFDYWRDKVNERANEMDANGTGTLPGHRKSRSTTPAKPKTVQEYYRSTDQYSIDQRLFAGQSDTASMIRTQIKGAEPTKRGPTPGISQYDVRQLRLATGGNQTYLKALSQDIADRVAARMTRSKFLLDLPRQRNQRAPEGLGISPDIDPRRLVGLSSSKEYQKIQHANAVIEAVAVGIPKHVAETLTKVDDEIRGSSARANAVNQAKDIAQSTMKRLPDKMQQLDDNVANALGMDPWARAMSETAQHVPKQVQDKLREIDQQVANALNPPSDAPGTAKRMMDAVDQKLQRIDADVQAALANSGAQQAAEALAAAARRWFERLQGALGQIPGKLPPERYAGGLVRAGQTALVGELGPEAFVTAGGLMSMVGLRGPELRTFSSSGAVLPASATSNPWTGNLGNAPQWALSSIQDAYLSLADVIVGSSLQAQFSGTPDIYSPPERQLPSARAMAVLNTEPRKISSQPLLRSDLLPILSEIRSERRDTRGSITHTVSDIPQVVVQMNAPTSDPEEFRRAAEQAASAALRKFEARKRRQ